MTLKLLREESQDTFYRYDPFDFPWLHTRWRVWQLPFLQIIIQVVSCRWHDCKNWDKWPDKHLLLELTHDYHSFQSPKQCSCESYITSILTCLPVTNSQYGYVASLGEGQLMECGSATHTKWHDKIFSIKQWVWKRMRIKLFFQEWHLFHC